MTDEHLTRRANRHSTAYRVGRAVILSAVGVASVPFAGAGALLVRLAFGPLDISPLARHFLPIVLQEGDAGRPPVARITVRKASLAWPALGHGTGTPLVVAVRDLQILDAAGKKVDGISSGEVGLDVHALTKGQVALRGLTLSGARFALVRHHSGKVGLDIEGLKSGGASPQIDVNGLHLIAVGDTRVVLRDELIHQTIGITVADTQLSVVHLKQRMGITGAIVADLGVGTLHSTLRADGVMLPDNDGVRWSLALAAFKPSTLGAIVPSLAPIDIPTTLRAVVEARAGQDPTLLSVSNVSASVLLGQGRYTQKDGSQLFVRSGSLTLGIEPEISSAVAIPTNVTIKDLDVDLARDDASLASSSGDHLHLHASAQAKLSDLVSPKKIDASVAAAIDTSFQFTDLPHYWPLGLAGGARKWVVRNITGGTGSNLHVNITLASQDGPEHLRATTATGGLQGKGLQVYWLRPAPPLNDVDGDLVLEGPDALKINFDHGYQSVERTGRNVGATGSGKLISGAGTMKIENLAAKTQIGTITPQFSGDLRDVLALLAEPRLHLLSRHPLAFTNPSGKAKVTFTLRLPLTSKVTMPEISLDAHASLSNVTLGNVVMGRGVTKGQAEMDATMQGLDLKGQGILQGIKSRLHYTMDFASISGVHVTEHAVINAEITPQAAESAGIPAGSYFDGTAHLNADYVRRSDASAAIKLALQMRDTAIKIPLWRKPMGSDAVASVTLGFIGGHLNSIDDLSASGNDLSIAGGATVDTGIAKSLDLSSFRIGRSRGRARIGIPRSDHDPIMVSVVSPVLDLSPLFGTDQASDVKAKTSSHAASSYRVPEAASGKPQGAPGRGWTIDLSAQKLFYKPKSQLGGVHVSMTYNGVRITDMNFTMQAPTPGTVRIWSQNNTRRARLGVDDLGVLLHSLDVVHNIRGGKAVMDGAFNDTEPSAPFTGTLKVGPFVMHDAPDALRLANQLSPAGWADGLPASDFPVDFLQMPLVYRDGAFTISNGEISNESLGATLRGVVNTDGASYDLRGTVSPIFSVNSLPGKLPGLGHLFSPEKGGGVVSATYTITGPFSKPKVAVNPFAVFLPGVLRKMVE